MARAKTDRHDLVVRKLQEVTRQLQEAAVPIQEGEEVLQQLERLTEAVDEVGKAWSGSWLGHHATIYINGLRPARAGELFDQEWGTVTSRLNRTRGDWAEFDFDAVVAAVYELGGLDDDAQGRIDALATAARKTYDRARRNLETTLRALLRVEKDENVEALLSKIKDEVRPPTASALLKAMMPTGNLLTRDSTAGVSGLNTPPHLSVLAKARYWRAQLYGCQLLAESAEEVLEYLLTKYQLEGSTTLRSGRAVFIGHGHSQEWIKLSVFLDKRLGLDPVEYNSESAAGKSRQDRLDEMKESVDFAFLVFTAEDEQGDGTKRARQNVVEEYGLMSAVLGRQRTIILHEEGCELPSNEDGIDYIHFPKGLIQAAFEDVRRVLEREGMI